MTQEPSKATKGIFAPTTAAINCGQNVESTSSIAMVTPRGDEHHQGEEWFTMAIARRSPWCNCNNVQDLCRAYYAVRERNRDHNKIYEEYHGNMGDLEKSSVPAGPTDLSRQGTRPNLPIPPMPCFRGSLCRDVDRCPNKQVGRKPLHVTAHLEGHHAAPLFFFFYETHKKSAVYARAEPAPNILSTSSSQLKTTTDPYR